MYGFYHMVRLQQDIYGHPLSSQPASKTVWNLAELNKDDPHTDRIQAEI